MLALPPSVAQLAGAGERARIGALFRQALWLALGLGVCCSLRCGMLAACCLRRSASTASIVADTSKFLHAISWGAPALTAYFALRGFSEGLA